MKRTRTMQPKKWIWKIHLVNAQDVIDTPTQSPYRDGRNSLIKDKNLILKMFYNLREPQVDQQQVNEGWTQLSLLPKGRTRGMEGFTPNPGQLQWNCCSLHPGTALGWGLERKIISLLSGLPSKPISACPREHINNLPLEFYQEIIQTNGKLSKQVGCCCLRCVSRQSKDAQGGLSSSCFWAGRSLQGL